MSSSFPGRSVPLLPGRLVRAFGFVEHAATRGPDGSVWTAQLRARSGLVMIGPGMDEFGRRPVADPDWATCRVHVLVDGPTPTTSKPSQQAVIRSEPAAHFGGERIHVASDCGGQQWIFAEPVAQ